MRILILFFDMLRSNKLKICNPFVDTAGPLEPELYKLGGTVYNNCYSPAPDSARSLASFYTGVYPVKHGCQKTHFAPRFYLNKDIKHLFDIFNEAGYENIIHVHPGEFNYGILPQTVSNYTNLTYTLEDFMAALEKGLAAKDSILAYGAFYDFHTAMSVWGYTNEAYCYGQLRLAGIMNTLFTRFSPDDFDLILLFSDHGFLHPSDYAKLSPIMYGFDHRSKTYLQIRKRGQSSITINSDLHSLMQLFPFLAQEINAPIDPAMLDAVSITQQSSQFIMIEDQTYEKKLRPSPQNLWAVRTPEQFYFKTPYEDRLYQALSPHQYEQIVVTPDTRDKFSELLDNYSCGHRYRHYSEEQVQTVYQKFTIDVEAIETYRQSSECLQVEDNSKTYSDGTMIYSWKILPQLLINLIKLTYARRKYRLRCWFMHLPKPFQRMQWTLPIDWEKVA